MKGITSIVAGVLLSAAGLASAAQPVTLSDLQMDSVSAGATALAGAFAGAGGSWSAYTDVGAGTETFSIFYAGAGSYSTAIAVSIPFVGGPAVAESGSFATASLP